ncbi:MAG: hypothetical protein LC748_01280 [Thermomicrobia bacterium]|nr:hypothetical protein [Thermomicrobia bacterium]
MKFSGTASHLNQARHAGRQIEQRPHRLAQIGRRLAFAAGNDAREAWRGLGMDMQIGLRQRRNRRINRQVG